MKKLFQIVLVSSLSLLCFSCYYDDIQEDIITEIPDLPDDPNDPDYVEILFQTDIQPIFNDNCVQCHNENRDPDLRDGEAYRALVTDYVTRRDADDSLLYITLADGHQELALDKIALIKGWINQGAKNN